MEHKGRFFLLVGLLVMILIAATFSATFSYFGASMNNNEGTTVIQNNQGKLVATMDPVINAGMVNAGEKIAVKNISIAGSSTVSDNLSYELDLKVNNNTYPEGTLFYTITSTKDNGIAIASSSTPVAIPGGTSIIKIGEATFAGPIERGTHNYVLTIYRSEGAPIQPGEASLFSGELVVE